jgi:uncharacterized membrane protein YheB (UPF0754 family)
MTGHLFWALPPLIGAIIGYVTNLVAIKMLFRPLDEVRLFGLRLPFTPGILPKERRKLADNIGEMVQRELLTAGVLRERLEKPEVRENIHGAISTYTGKVLEQPVSSWLEEGRGELPLSGLLKDFVNSEVFNSFLEEVIREWAARKIPSSRYGSGKTDNNAAGNDTFSDWLKSKARDVGAMFMPAAREIIKSGLTREIKNRDSGEVSLYRQALENTLTKYPGITMKEFLSVAEAKKAAADSYFSAKTHETLDENIEHALQSVDVKALVADRINSLDMVRVEKIVLDVMAGQLKWINVFGAILGALIGFSQVVLFLFMR